MHPHPDRWCGYIIVIVDDRPSRIRVVIIEDHAMMAQGLLAALRDVADIEVVGLAGTLADGEQVVASHAPDVLVTDFRLPDGDAPDAITRLAHRAPGVRVLVVSAMNDYRSVVRAVEAGAAGYLLKDQLFDELVSGIRAVHDGERAIAPSLVPTLLGQFAPSGGVGARLTRRELEVLQLMAHGLTNAEVAIRLNVSLNTVRNHIQSVISRLGAHSKLEAVTIGLRQGIIQPPDTGGGERR